MAKRSTRTTTLMRPVKPTHVNRRTFLLCGGAMAADALMANRSARVRAETKDSAQGFAAPGFRSITYNVRHCEGWGARKDHEAQLMAARPRMPERVAAELALYNPDLITLMEAPEEPGVEEIARRLGMKYVYYGQGAPSALLTRCRIVESADHPGIHGSPGPEEVRGRHFGRAVLDTPLGPVIVYSAHLTSRDQEQRKRQVAAILDVMGADVQANRSLLMQGDLNHTPGWPEYRQWVAAGLIDAATAKGNRAGNTHASGTPALRIDYIWLHGPLAGRLEQCRVLFEGAFRLKLDDPSAFALSDHLPVMAEFA